jgi:hypothetical protein
VSAIDFIIPSFNAARTLADTLRSVLAQTRPDFTCVVVDDGSSDATHAVARSFADPRIRVITQENRGLSAARNRGLAESSSPFVAFLDADDVVESSFAARMILSIGSRAEFDLAPCATRFLGPQLQRLDWINPVLASDLAPGRLLMGNPIAVGAVVVRRASLQRLGVRGDVNLFDPALPCVEDWDAWMRLSIAGARWAPPIDEALFGYRLTPGSMSSDHARMWKAGLAVIDRAAPRIDAALRDSARRRWTLTRLARVLVEPGRPPRDEPARSMVEAISPLHDEDDGVLGTSLRDAIARHEGVPPAHLSDDARAARTLDPILRESLGANRARAILQQLASARDRWTEAAQAFLALDRAPGSRLILMGMGRNGHRLCSALESLVSCGERPTLFWCDDAPLASPPTACTLALQRLDIDDVRSEDVVLVTPDDRAALMARLGGRCRVETLDSLAAHRADHPANAAHG